MSIDEKQTCNMHTKEKKESGECCQINAEQQTYEHSVPTMSIYELAKTNPSKKYRELEKMKEQYE